MKKYDMNTARTSIKEITNEKKRICKTIEETLRHTEAAHGNQESISPRYLRGNS